MFCAHVCCASLKVIVLYCIVYNLAAKTVAIAWSLVKTHVETVAHLMVKGMVFYCILDAVDDRSRK